MIAGYPTRRFVKVPSAAGLELSLIDGDAPALRRLLLHELSSMLYPPGNDFQPRWIAVGAGSRDQPVGGLIGLTNGAWFSIDLVWLPEMLRGRGLGSELLRLAEQRASEYGCIGAYVLTTSERAARFYQRHGYVVRLRLPKIRPGLTQITLQKDFDQAQIVPDPIPS